MKRSDALKLIANQLDFLAGKFEGARTEFTEDELSKADVILTTLEQAGMTPPMTKGKSFTILDSGEIVYAYHAWEE